jgi:hypothetical protein
MKIRLILVSLLCGLSVGTQAETVRQANASASGSNAALEAALQACAAQVKADAAGRPDRNAFDACMRAKGFEKPAGPPPGGMDGRGAPPQ